MIDTYHTALATRDANCWYVRHHIRRAAHGLVITRLFGVPKVTESKSVRHFLSDGETERMLTIKEFGTLVYKSDLVDEAS